MRAWTFLIVSGLFEVGWIVSLKMTSGFSRFVPLAGYVLCGGAAALFLSLALKTIPMGTAYAVWMAVSVVGALFVDAAWFKQPTSGFQIACAILIVAGTCGLKVAG